MSQNPSMPEWYDADEAARLMGTTRRTASRLLSRAGSSLVRLEAAGRGRPRARYHISAHPRLFAAAELSRRGGVAAEAPKAKPQRHLDAADLALAQLRAAAVEEYMARRYEMSETRAAVSTQAAWAAAPRETSVRLIVRLPGNRRRERVTTLSVGGFSCATLRRWAAVYLPRKDLTALAPARKARAGRSRCEIPGALLDLIHALAVSTPRADVAAAIERARAEWPGQWPQVCDRTLLRRLRERDPARVCDTLGKGGISRFRQAHSPDIARDWNQARYNEEWQLDDITQDFYGHAESDPTRIIRPYAYAIIRCSTREWVAAVATETPLTKEQVRPLLGFALSSPRGGIPERIRFERGSVACDEYLAGTLEQLGIQVCRTSMDGGEVYPGAFSDRAKGHFQGKGVVESNIRLSHRGNAFALGQVGTNERHTASSRLDAIKDYARACAKEGKPSILPTAAQWQAMIFKALENHNNRPHGSLPEIALDDGTTRHMTPNERARSLTAPVSVMPETLLPLFFAVGVSVPVTKNGIRFNNEFYGRFDDDVQSLAGGVATVYGSPDIPGAVYVEQLGRCVERFEPVAPGAEGTLIERKRSIERTARNQYEGLIERARAGLAAGVGEAMAVTADPWPERPRMCAAAPELEQRASRLTAAASGLRTERTARRARFDFDGSAGRPVNNDAQAGRGLLAQADRFAAQSKAYAEAGAPNEQSPFAGLVE